MSNNFIGPFDMRQIHSSMKGNAQLKESDVASRWPIEQL